MIIGIKLKSGKQVNSDIDARGHTALVVARNASELMNRLTVDKNARANNNSDSCRVGFVAFRRLKTLLCYGRIENNLCKSLCSDGNRWHEKSDRNRSLQHLAARAFNQLP